LIAMSLFPSKSSDEIRRTQLRSSRSAGKIVVVRGALDGHGFALSRPSAQRKHSARITRAREHMPAAGMPLHRKAPTCWRRASIARRRPGSLPGAGQAISLPEKARGQKAVNPKGIGGLAQ
jgi:hypothetical protein